MTASRRAGLQFIILSIGVFMILATKKPEKPTLPIKGNLFYLKTITLERQSVTNVRVGSIAGKRCYNDSSGTYQTHSFKFDDAADKITVTIADTHGVQPGSSFEYTLFFKNIDGIVKPSSVFRLRMSNPFTSPQPKFTETWTLTADGSGSPLAILPGTELGGVYELGSSDRELSVDLDFNLTTAIPFSEACSDYN